MILTTVFNQSQDLLSNALPNQDHEDQGLGKALESDSSKDLRSESQSNTSVAAAPNKHPETTKTNPRNSKEVSNNRRGESMRSNGNHDQEFSDHVDELHKAKDFNQEPRLSTGSRTTNPQSRRPRMSPTPFSETMGWDTYNNRPPSGRVSTNSFRTESVLKGPKPAAAYRFNRYANASAFLDNEDLIREHFGDATQMGFTHYNPNFEQANTGLLSQRTFAQEAQPQHIFQRVIGPQAFVEQHSYTRPLSQWSSRQEFQEDRSLFDATSNDIRSNPNFQEQQQYSTTSYQEEELFSRSSLRGAFSESTFEPPQDTEWSHDGLQNNWTEPSRFTQSEFLEQDHQDVAVDLPAVFARPFWRA